MLQLPGLVALFWLPALAPPVAALRNLPSAEAIAWVTVDVQGPRIGSFGFDLPGRNLSVRPGDDFFGFANGKYIAELEIPADRSRWGSFDQLSDDAEKALRRILENDQRADGKAGRFYASFMNESLADALDLAPLQPALGRLRAAATARDLAVVLGGGQTRGYFSAPFSIGVFPDSMNVNEYAVHLDQAGLGLAREYYLEEQYRAKKAAYARHIEVMLEMAEYGRAGDLAKEVLAMEDRVANASMAPEELRDPLLTYNPMTLENLTATAPGFHWEAWLGSAGPLPASAKLVVQGLRGVVGIAQVLATTDLEVLKAWAAFHLVRNAAPYLSARFVNASFNFSRQISGQATLSPRWRRGVQLLDANMGEAVGKLYVDGYFSPEKRAAAKNLTIRVKDAFEGRLQGLTWMSDATKQRALEKLRAMNTKIGYPEQWRDYTGLNIEEGDLFGNVERSTDFHWSYWLAKLTQPVDHSLWDMTPQTVNAYYEPSLNEIVFPAAILQPPFFDPEADMAVNYGGIGAVIGHEITHGFDDEGRHYNSKGKLEDWWTSEDEAEFNRRANLYGKQFKSFKLWLPPGGQINPQLTMGENLADLGGLGLALEAYRSTFPDGVAPQVQMRHFFLGYAQVWREKVRPDTAINYLLTDGHSPSAARVDMPLRNMAAWYEAFNVTSDDALYLSEADRVVVWGPQSDVGSAPDGADLGAAIRGGCHWLSGALLLAGTIKAALW